MMPQGGTQILIHVLCPSISVTLLAVCAYKLHVAVMWHQLRFHKMNTQTPLPRPPQRQYRMAPIKCQTCKVGRDTAWVRYGLLVNLS